MGVAVVVWLTGLVSVWQLETERAALAAETQELRKALAEAGAGRAVLKEKVAALTEANATQSDQLSRQCSLSL